MKINNELRTSKFAETHDTQPEQDNKESFKSSPASLQSSISEALEVAGKAFEHVVSTVFGQHQATQQQNVQTIKNALDNKDKDLQSQDKLGNFEIQSLMSNFNQAQTTASSVTKKADDTGNSIIKNF